MRVLYGAGMHRGSASGIVYKYVTDLDGEPVFDLLINQKEVLKTALVQSTKDLEEAVIAVGPTMDDTIRMIFEAHKLMVNDPILLDAAFAAIETGQSAYQAYQTAAQAIIKHFQTLKNDYMRNRVIDIIDATDRVLHAIVSAEYKQEFRFPETRILVMDQMRPSVILNCQKPFIGGLIAETGSIDQHSALIARSKGLPTVIFSQAMATLHNGDFVTIDGDAGTITVAPAVNR
ncbi:MAG: phosphoenolpyruvate-utilizing N-terminal domain-containing protein [bacterium]